jgi:hypothetical protein
MAHYGGSGKTTVESCRCIDVLDWHRRGCLRSPRRFSWTWTQDGKRMASINVETERHRVTLKYRNRPYGGEWVDAKQQFPVTWTPCRFGGDRPWFVCSVYANGAYCGRQVASSTMPVVCLPAVIVLGLPTRASRNPPMNEVY